MSAKQYFERYSEQETALLSDIGDAIISPYQQVLCLPIYDESIEVIQRIAVSAQAYGKNILLIAVVNQPENTVEIASNQHFTKVIAQYPKLWQKQHLSLHNHHPYLNILLIQRFRGDLQIPKKQGVGLARKIACDCAAYLIETGAIQSSHIFSSDSDVHFPNRYFSASLQAKHSAAYIAFKHIPSGDTAIDKATLIYQQSLHHYVEGLRSASSAYAYHTIGSTLLIDGIAYIKVRGFPKRAGAEDFYLLNKLNKIAPIHAINDIKIGIESRVSQRVPFGTGPAVEKLLSHNSRLFFDSRSFSLLALWIKTLIAISNIDDMDKVMALIHKQELTIISISHLLDTKTTLTKIWRNHHNQKARTRALHDWFDAFKTLKVLNFISKNNYPKLDHQQHLIHKDNKKQYPS